MDTLTAATALGTIVSIAGIWFLLNYWFPDLIIDVFRQRLFNVRARLFEFAAAGNIAFDDFAYCRLRTMLNGYIRFAHRLDAFQLLLMNALVSRKLRAGVSITDPVSEWEAALQAQPEAVRAQLMQFRDEMHKALVHHLLISSLLLLPVMLPILALIGAWRIVLDIARHTVSSLREIGDPFRDLQDRVALRTDSMIGTIDALELAA